ncbi:MAG: hypothetical protein JXR70_14205 [Spirochaetales bacterium]|nr:hypothetical protein [Spirochaetales bacterium]
MSQQSKDNLVNKGSQDNLDSMIKGIMDDAQKEADKLINEAKVQAQERSEAREIQIKRLLKEAEDKAAAQVKIIEQQSASSIKVESKRIYLKVRDEIIQSILKNVENELVRLQDNKDYRKILKDMIIEAAFGLNSPEAFVNASAKEREMLSPALLKEAADETSKMLGKAIKLELSKEAPLLTQGVTLTAGDHRTAFNNTFSTRMLRYQSEIRKLIYDKLFKD